MLFNSYAFLFGFLPVTLFGFYLLGMKSRTWALGWIIFASLVFYAWWRPINVLIIGPAVLINFLLARILQRLNAANNHSNMGRVVLLIGIAFNVAFLGYFKYVNFLTSSINDLAGTNIVLAQIILPLGISFITFQKIAFLIDVHSRRIESFSFRDFSLFVLFFPQLVAGPIVHYREMMPQFDRLKCRLDKEDISVGLTLLFIGLFKKVVLADGIAAQVSPIYELASAGGGVSLLPAWIAAIGFTLQIYFDFSGYTDMALGLGRCFGLRLPANFDSPLKATSIVDFWLRWHMTLTRFLTAYLYNPMVLWLTRRRVAKGLPGLAGRRSSLGAFLQLLVGPTILTMLVSGIWHGAGYLFILWGLLHGVYLSINHGWRLIASRYWHDKEKYTRIMKPAGFMLTFISVAVSMVIFRSSTFHGATEVLRGMTGLNGIVLPQKIVGLLGPAGHWLQPIITTSGEGTGRILFTSIAWVAALLLIALKLPNSLELTARYEPAIGVRPSLAGSGKLAWAPEWRQSIAWGLAISTLAATAMLQLGAKSEFLYWQF